MCGIAGSINFSIDINKLAQSLVHRGPDAQNTYRDNNVILHHHRLSIVDISDGHQPMHHEHLTIVFNGEIYNHQELRKKYNLKCKTNSDTEVILHLYLQMGASCLHCFDGMFAFVLYDRRAMQLFIARDRAGKKPLYYYSDERKFLFSSELNALHSQLPLEINEEPIRQYIRMGYFYKSNTVYKNVFELPAGSYATVLINKPIVEIEEWWNIHNFYLNSSNDDFQIALEKADTYLHTAVKGRVESSDIEVGSFLSGGIDSGIVTAIAKEYSSSLKTFTVAFEGEYNEAPLARLVADRYNTKHQEINISFDNLKNDVETILSNYGEPFFDSSAIPSYYVSKEAKKHVTVILNGDGGDELFSGYRRYLPFSKYDFFNVGFIVKNFAALLVKLLPASNNKKSKYNFIYRLADFARKGGLETYLTATVDSFEGSEKHLIESTTAFSEVLKNFEKINRSSLSGLRKIMNLDFDNILVGNLLVKMDIATMAHSLEGRSPFLSKELLEYIPTISDSYKINGRSTKFLLRRLAQKYLPSEIIHQPKRGFEIPLKRWVDGDLKDMIAFYILSPNAYSNNFVQTKFIYDLWNKRTGIGDEKRAKIIWTLFALEIWYNKCYMRHA